MKRRHQTTMHYIAFNKPYAVLSQFTPAHEYRTLRDFGPFPADVYPVGRLDADSEGLLLLTNDRHVAHHATDPRYGHPRTYLVQIERIPGDDVLQALQDGVLLAGKKTRAATVTFLHTGPDVPPREVPIRFRKNVPTAWIMLTLREGRNRQVRRMTAAVGHPTLRLIRVALGDITLEGLRAGESRSLSAREVAALKSSLDLAQEVHPDSSVARDANKKPGA